MRALPLTINALEPPDCFSYALNSDKLTVPTYIMTAKRIISGEVVKYRNGLGISGDYETRFASASHFTLTMPRIVLLVSAPRAALAVQACASDVCMPRTARPAMKRYLLRRLCAVPQQRSRPLS